ncbi:macrophage colony-stimulating factor 1 receptor [Electrophorus electricus]|uniref:macrophage colony-stimulating factor 1 receptor n=1 Tax=Electrophorus electricus TaxID=8005 RepID=UPI0015CFF522|nr:macrophage colony-stimulating factor 1 receptor [Electrophorus electricus]
MLLLTLALGLLSCQVHGWSEPQISVNGDLNGADVILNVGSRLHLTCEGDGPVKLTPWLAKHRRYVKSSGNSSTFSVTKTDVWFTGPYKCEYTTRNDRNVSSVHVFVRDPRFLFVTPSTSRSVVVKEGQDALLRCLITDPAATDVHLRMNNGTAAPLGMNMTFDPRKGMQLRNLLPSYTADYVCAGKIAGVEKVSAIFSLNVMERLRCPPDVFLRSVKYVRLVGERLQITCSIYNPNFNFKVTWRHSSGAKLQSTKEKPKAQGSGMTIDSVLTLEAVKLSDSGNITCTATNEAGVNSSTIQLQVVEEPYLRVSPRPEHQGLSLNVKEGEDIELWVSIEAYPPVAFHGWETPAFPNTSNPEIEFKEIGNNRYEAVLFLRRLNSDEQGRYTFHASSSRTNASITFHIHMYQKPVVTVRETNTSLLTCTSFGYPPPSIVWYKCQGTRPTCTDNSSSWETLQLVTPQPLQGEEVWSKKVESVVAIEPSNQKITMECVARNDFGEDSTVFLVDHSEKFFRAMLAGAVGMMAFLLLLLLLLYRYQQKPKYEIRWKIIEATDGNNYTFIDPTQLPYNKKLEFPRDKLKLGKILGSGAFGKVVEATAYGLGKEDTVTRVAVKMLKARAHSDEKEALMSELKILSHLGQHENIVNLLGACTYGGPVLVITEYCCHGDLLNFLRSKAETFLNCVLTIPGITEEKNDYKNVTAEKMFIRSDSGFSSTCSDQYLAMRPTQFRSSTTTQVSTCEDPNVDSWPLDMDDLLKFSYQVAQGLEFLTAKNCIHRDVAARNVLLADRCVAKICDFGLARDIMNDSNYVVKGNARLPVKWMAPESIFECVYTVQSDVWSYGILLWEIFSLGKSPYPNILVDSKFYKMIKSGYQMSRPDFAPPEMYTVMKMCWNLEPTERPTFSKISQLIERLLGDTPQQTQHHNVQSEVLDEEQLKSCDTAKTNEESCDQEEEEQPLMKANNYQFC